MLGLPISRHLVLEVRKPAGEVDRPGVPVRALRLRQLREACRTVTELPRICSNCSEIPVVVSRTVHGQKQWEARCYCSRSGWYVDRGQALKAARRKAIAVPDIRCFSCGDTMFLLIEGPAYRCVNCERSVRP